MSTPTYRKGRDVKSARLLSNLLMDRFSSRGPLDGRFERHFRFLAVPQAANEVLLRLEAFTHRSQGGAAIEVSKVEIRVEMDGSGAIFREQADRAYLTLFSQRRERSAGPIAKRWYARP